MTSARTEWLWLYILYICIYTYVNLFIYIYIYLFKTHTHTRFYVLRHTHMCNCTNPSFECSSSFSHTRTMKLYTWTTWTLSWLKCQPSGDACSKECESQGGSVPWCTGGPRAGGHCRTGWSKMILLAFQGPTIEAHRKEYPMQLECFCV